MSNPTKVTFTLPTTNDDGTPFDVATLTGVKINVNDPIGNLVSSTVVDKDHLNLDGAGNGTINLPALANGSYFVQLYTEAVSQDTAVESVSSVAVPFAIAKPSIPNPPTAVSVV